MTRRDHSGCYGVRAAYERIEVLHGVDLSVRAGTVFALLGPNGAGKTTTLKVIAGLMRPTARRRRARRAAGERRSIRRTWRGEGCASSPRATGSSRT